MFQSSKLIRGCPPLFVFFLLSHLTGSLFLHQAYAQTIPSRRETQDALHTISNFLQNETGAIWLAGLAQNQQRAPLTTDELMEAVMGVTEKDGEVWRAAATVRSALAAEAQQKTASGTKMTTELSDLVTDDLSDVLIDMEKHDDIICLYRKNNEAKMKKSADWQKLLKNVSPGYTVHLALDRGNKYVICLKKVNVPTTQAPQTISSTLPPTEDSTITIPTSTQSTQSFEESSVMTTETQSSTIQSTITEVLPTTESFIEDMTLPTVEKILNTKRESNNLEKDTDNNNKNFENIIENNSEGITTDRIEINHVTPNKIAQDGMCSEKKESTPLKLKRQNLPNYVDSHIKSVYDTSNLVLNKHDCFKKPKAQEIISGLEPIIIIPLNSRLQGLSTSENKLPIVASLNSSPSLSNVMCYIPYIPQVIWLMLRNTFVPCKSLPNIDPNTRTQLTTMSNIPFLRNKKNIPTWFNFGQPIDQKPKPNNMNFKSMGQIAPNAFNLNEPLPKFPRHHLYYGPILTPVNHNYWVRSSQFEPSINSLCKMNQACSQMLLASEQEQMRKPAIPNVIGSLSNVNRTRSAHTPLMDWKSIFLMNQIKAPLQRTAPGLIREPIFQEPRLTAIRNTPSFMLPSSKPCIHNFDEFSGVGEASKAFGWLNPIDLPYQIEPQINLRHLVKQPVMSPFLQPSFNQNSLLGTNLQKRFIPNFPTSIPSVESPNSPFGVSFFQPNLNQLPVTSNYPTTKSTTSSTSIPFSRYSNMESHQAKILKNLFLTKTPIAQNLPPPYFIQRQSNLIPKTVTSILLRQPKFEQGNDNSCRNTQSLSEIQGPESSIGQGTNQKVRNLFDLWKIPKQHIMNNANSEISHTSTDPNAEKTTIPLQIRIQSSTNEPIRINVVPGKGENVKVIDAEKGLFQLNLPNKILENGKYWGEKSLQKSVDNETGNLEVRIDETAAEFNNRRHRKNAIKNEDLPTSTARLMLNTDENLQQKVPLKVKQITKLKHIFKTTNTSESKRAVKDTLNKAHHTTENHTKVIFSDY